MAEENKISDLMQEYELSKRMESVFKPYTRKQRDAIVEKLAPHPKAHPSEIRFRCAHYTSAEAALKIIKSKRIWMRNTTCMSDYREVQHGYQSLLSFFGNSSNKDAFITTLNTCADGVAQEAIKLFDSWWQNIQFNTYILSMSEHDNTEDLRGRLSMWRAFQSSSARVALIFKIPWMSRAPRALNLIFSPVVYSGENEIHKEMHEVIANIKKECNFLRASNRQLIIDWVFGMLVSHATCTKHEGFKEEREWRAIYGPNRLPSKFIKSSTEIVNGIPQPIYSLPLDATVDPILADIDFSVLFDRIIIGPSPYPGVMAEAFFLALKEAGVTEPEKRIFKSDIPIRT